MAAKVVALPGHEPLRTRRQLAEHYQVTVRTIKRWDAQGMPRALSGPVRYRISETDAWLERRHAARISA